MAELAACLLVHGLTSKEHEQQIVLADTPGVAVLLERALDSVARCLLVEEESDALGFEPDLTDQGTRHGARAVGGMIEVLEERVLVLVDADHECMAVFVIRDRGRGRESGRSAVTLSSVLRGSRPGGRGDDHEDRGHQPWWSSVRNVSSARFYCRSRPAVRSCLPFWLVTREEPGDTTPRAAGAKPKGDRPMLLRRSTHRPLLTTLMTAGVLAAAPLVADAADLGRCRDGVDLDGDAYESLVVPHSDALQPAEELTVEAWVYLRDLGTDDRILEKGDGSSVGSDRAYSLFVFNGNIVLTLFFEAIGSREAIWLSTNPIQIPTDEWLHFAATFSKSAGEGRAVHERRSPSRRPTPRVRERR